MKKRILRIVILAAMLPMLATPAWTLAHSVPARVAGIAAAWYERWPAELRTIAFLTGASLEFGE
ncbi:MAG: hypothetical protein R2729_25430 [Bryobacteraceae bacterium]